MEVNSTSYAVPGAATVAGAAVTPPDFSFDVKLHRALSRHAAPVDSLPTDLRELADAELSEIGARAAVLAEEADTVRLMFNNNRGSDAPVAAARMRELLGQAPAPPAPRAGEQHRLA